MQIPANIGLFKEWFGRIKSPQDREKVWVYMTTNERFNKVQQQLLGDKFILWAAAASAYFNLPNPPQPPYVYKNNLSTTEWARGYYEEQRARLLHENIKARYDPSPRDLDRLWTLFYATGDRVFLNQLVYLTKNGRSDVIRMAAAWSYESHKTSRRLDVALPKEVVAKIRELVV